MKYMDIPALTSMGIELEQNAVDCVLDARLECYSCKMVTADKRSYRDFINTPGRGGAGNSLQPLSPPTLDDCVVSGEPSTAGCSSRTSDESSDSPTFRMCDVISNKTLFYLIETLNASFPDYTFFNASSESFTKAPSVKHFMESVNTKLMPYIKNYNMLKMYLWPVVDSAISLAGCIAYSRKGNGLNVSYLDQQVLLIAVANKEHWYLPLSRGDPYTEPGCIWSFNHIIFNRSLNRILFFSCRAMNPSSVVQDASDEYQWDFDD
ncbi:Maf1 regulator [Trichuris suis]|nr:Maf1 regulator [Trichuris suis]